MIYVMSDIHGCDGRYRNILKQIKLKADDHLYILGDVIDRGPRGLSILRETMQKENITLLMGNHEHMMLEVLTDPDDANALWLWYRNGGKVTHDTSALHTCVSCRSCGLYPKPANQHRGVCKRHRLCPRTWGAAVYLLRILPQQDRPRACCLDPAWQEHSHDGRKDGCFRSYTYASLSA